MTHASLMRRLMRIAEGHLQEFVDEPQEPRSEPAGPWLYTLIPAFEIAEAQADGVVARRGGMQGRKPAYTIVVRDELPAPKAGVIIARFARSALPGVTFQDRDGWTSLQSPRPFSIPASALEIRHQGAWVPLTP